LEQISTGKARTAGYTNFRDTSIDTKAIFGGVTPSKSTLLAEMFDLMLVLGYGIMFNSDSDGFEKSRCEQVD